MGRGSNVLYQTQDPVLRANAGKGKRHQAALLLRFYYLLKTDQEQYPFGITAHDFVLKYGSLFDEDAAKESAAEQILQTLHELVSEGYVKQLNPEAATVNSEFLLTEAGKAEGLSLNKFEEAQHRPLA